MVDVSVYNDCLVKNDHLCAETLNKATEAQRVASLPPEEQKAFAMDHCLAVMHINNVMEKAFSESV